MNAVNDPAVERLKIAEKAFAKASTAVTQGKVAVGIGVLLISGMIFDRATYGVLGGAVGSVALIGGCIHWFGANRDVTEQSRRLNEYRRGR